VFRAWRIEELRPHQPQLRQENSCVLLAKTRRLIGAEYSTCFLLCVMIRLRYVCLTLVEISTEVIR
jgi:hypothetical protein